MKLNQQRVWRKIININGKETSESTETTIIDSEI